MEGDWVFPAPFATLLPDDPDTPAGLKDDLSDVLTAALSSPAQSVLDVLTGGGLGDLDLDLAAVGVLAVTLWALPADQRPTVAALCEHP
jgi:hypothetical protein